jgi:hypothetical protein
VYPVTIDPTTTLQPDESVSKDTYIDAIANNSSYGSDANLWIGTTISGYKWRTLWQQDLSSIPMGSNVTEALLTLQQTFADSQGIVCLTKFYKNTSDWTEATTWNTAPTFDATEVASANFSANGAYSINITTVVSSWINGGVPNYGLTIKGDEVTANTRKKFASSASGTSAYWPKLVVTYTAGGTNATVNAVVATATAQGIAPTINAGACIQAATETTNATANPPTVTGGAQLLAQTATVIANALVPKIYVPTTAPAYTWTEIPDRYMAKELPERYQAAELPNRYTWKELS